MNNYLKINNIRYFGQRGRWKNSYQSFLQGLEVVVGVLREGESGAFAAVLWRELESRADGEVVVLLAAAADEGGVAAFGKLLRPESKAQKTGAFVERPEVFARRLPGVGELIDGANIRHILLPASSSTV